MSCSLWWGLLRALGIESIVAGVFVLFAVFGFKRNYWLLIAALIGHGVFDFVHHFFIDNPGVPRWWPGFCLASDVVFGAWLTVRMMRRRQASVDVSAAWGDLNLVTDTSIPAVWIGDAQKSW
jgi:hypothetical protein